MASNGGFVKNGREISMSIERRISLRFKPEHFDKLDEKRFRSRLSFQELGTRLFDNWLTSETDEPLHSSLREPADPLLEKIAMIQANGDAGLLTLIQRAADLSYSLMKENRTPEDLAYLRAVAYGRAKPLPKPEAPPRPRGRPRKTA
jgi:hypothetical protein